MISRDWERKQNERRKRLLKKACDEWESLTQKERDIWNLEMMQTDIAYMSLAYRSGYHASLGRAIAVLKEVEKK